MQYMKGESIKPTKSRDSLTLKAKKIKLVIFDGDGVTFSGRVLISSSKGELLKERSYVDGLGICLLRDAGFKVAFVSGEKTGFVENLVKKFNGLPSTKNGLWSPVEVITGVQGPGKVMAAQKLHMKFNIGWDETAFMGDDLPDLSLFKKVGFKAAPSQAEWIIKNLADYISPRRGGDGAIRDLCDLLIEAKGINTEALRTR